MFYNFQINFGDSKNELYFWEFLKKIMGLLFSPESILFCNYFRETCISHMQVHLIDYIQET